MQTSLLVGNRTICTLTSGTRITDSFIECALWDCDPSLFRFRDTNDKKTNKTKAYLISHVVYY